MIPAALAGDNVRPTPSNERWRNCRSHDALSRLRDAGRAQRHEQASRWSRIVQNQQAELLALGITVLLSGREDCAADRAR